MVDHVDPGIERHVEGLPVGDVAAHQRTSLVGRLDPRRELFARHLHLLAGRNRPVAAGDEHLDDLGPLFDLLTHRPPELVGTVGAVDSAPGPHVPVPGEALVPGVPGRADVAAAGHEAGPTNRPSAMAAFIEASMANGAPR